MTFGKLGWTVPHSDFLIKKILWPKEFYGLKSILTIFFPAWCLVCFAAILLDQTSSDPNLFWTKLVFDQTFLEHFLDEFVTTPTQPQLKSWVWHENDFTPHTHQPPPQKTTTIKRTPKATFHLLLTRFWPNFYWKVSGIKQQQKQQNHCHQQQQKSIGVGGPKRKISIQPLRMYPTFSVLCFLGLWAQKRLIFANFLICLCVFSNKRLFWRKKILFQPKF